MQLKQQLQGGSPASLGAVSQRPQGLPLRLLQRREVRDRAVIGKLLLEMVELQVAGRKRTGLAAAVQIAPDLRSRRRGDCGLKMSKDGAVTQCADLVVRLTAQHRFEDFPADEELDRQ